ncbi:homeobox protein invected-like [Episyrphus balteatus]|uniref:homeobox protein invected-like n=1 Tax=Episyrphus balteatus TaxID=286459 RepID=UPI002486AE42|nr:homeobox protein invected-like [Episyrphus balteatus]
MTTLATSRLLLPPPPQLLPILSAAAALSSETLAHKMHPDKLLMHAHGVTSPRLCPTGQLMVKATPPPPSISSDSPLQYPATIADDDELTGDMNDEVASVCDSEDSELSVGQENCDRSNNNLISSADSGCVSRPSSVNGNNRLTEELIDPFAMAALRIPAAAAVAASSVPIVRPSPTRFQEEFLRKSHIYAEELMKQQMQFMAAARASAFSLRHSANTEQVTENINNFSGIHSHLSAISKMTQMSQMAAQNGGGESALSKLTAFGLVAQSAASANSSASSLNQLQQQMQAHLPFMNNNIHEPSLKFSIDNILKADFGRRITDPLNKLGGGGNGGAGGSSRARNNKRADKNLSSATSAKVVGGVGNAVATATTGTPIDLTSVCNNVGVASATATSSLISNHCTNSNDSTSTVFSSNYSTPVKSPTSASSATTNAASPSETGAGADNSAEACGSGNASTSSGSGNGGSGSNGPIVWPAWVYCTRYSDRPSSG